MKILAHRTLFSTLKTAGIYWWQDDAPRWGASISYYTIFAIGPVLLVAIAIAGALFDASTVQTKLLQQINDLVGPEGATAVQALLEGARRSKESTIATIIGAITFVIAATGAFLELEIAFNKIWRAPPRTGNVLIVFLDRARLFGFVVAVGFLLLVSLAVSAVLVAWTEWLQQGATLRSVL
jgi:membrane protein